jgi:hypothetical protein
MQKISASEAPDPPGGDFFVGGLAKKDEAL